MTFNFYFDNNLYKKCAVMKYSINLYKHGFVFDKNCTVNMDARMSDVKSIDLSRHCQVI